MSFCNHISEIISAVTGIIGVIIGSIITYCIETKRRKNDENNKILRKIYFQIYTELEYCYLSQNGILKGHDGAKNVSVADVKIQLKRLLEDNTEILDSGLFEIYHNIKSEQYFEYDITGSIADFKYLKLYAFLLKKMIGMQKKAKMTDKYFMKRLKYLYYQYLTWFNLMKYLMDWEQVEDILVQSFLFKRSFKSIANSVFIKYLCKNKILGAVKFIEVFKAYCFKDIVFPIFNKYFWQNIIQYYFLNKPENK